MAAPTEAYEPTETSTWRRYWIFQANPKQYDPRPELKPGNTIPWKISRFSGEYNIGDIVYLWIAGENAGIYAWAEVVNSEETDNSGKVRLDITYKGVLKDALTKTLLRNEGKAFDGLTILRSPTGTNFRVTALEAITLNNLFEAQSVEAPPHPDQIEDPNSSGSYFLNANYVLDYRYDREVKELMSACLQASRNLNGTFFPKLLIQFAIKLGTYLLKAKSYKGDLPVKLDPEILDRLSSFLSFAPNMDEVSAAPLSPELASNILVGEKTLRIIAEARRFAILTSGKEEIKLRHIFGAILQGTTEPFQNYVKELLTNMKGPDLATVRTYYVDAIVDKWPEDKKENWVRLISEDVTTGSDIELDPPLLTAIDSDSVQEAVIDSLDIDNEAIAISKLLCAHDAAPPIAIGLFGEWGSGKTFFMRRIQHHTKILSDYTANAGELQQNVYCGKVAQIWFNAWNYQDSNLWASLVNHVFSGLQQELKRINEGDDKFFELMKELDVERVNEQKLTAASSKLKKLKQASESNESRIDVLKNINTSLDKKAKDLPYKAPILKTLKGKSGEIADILGVKNASEDIEKLAGDIQGINTFIEEECLKKGWNNSIKRLKHSFLESWKHYPQYIFLVLIIMAIVTYIIMMPEVQVWLKSSVSVIFGSLGLLAQPIKKMSDVTTWLRDFKYDVDEQWEKNEKQLEHEINKNKKEIRDLESENEKNKGEEQEIEKEYRHLNGLYGEPNDETFANFIYDRADSVDYTENLGLISTVRRDFSRLNELLFSQRNTKDKGLPKLDRIILYIDDLDRCEPEKVVQVLQAIHLILAFPLFMVVVGVDARWLGRCLKDQYPFLIHERENGNNVNNKDPYAASTHDYLEKIFQIPFWLKPIDGTKANKMIKDILQRQTKTQTNEDIDQADKIQTGESNFNNQPKIPDQTDDSLFNSTEDQEEGYEEIIEEVDLTNENLISTRSLAMSEAELKYLEKLGGIVGRSPRAVKRFINLYRILKSSNQRARISGFSDENGEFRVPLLLLAIICGSPKTAEHFFCYLLNQEETMTLDKLITEAEKEKESDTWEDLRKSLTNTEIEKEKISVKDINIWLHDAARFSYREWMGT